MNTVKQREASIDIARGIGIILVVFGHVFPVYRVTSYIYAFHMPLFFLLSGCTLNLQRYLEDPWRFFLKNILRLMVPYFVAAICSYILYSYLAPTLSLPEISITAAVLGILNGNGNNLPFNNVLWFLPAFFCAGMIFLVLALMFKGIKLFIAVIFVSFSGIIIGSSHHLIFGLDIAMTTQFFIYFGHLFREAEWLKKIERSDKKGMLNCLALMLIFIMLFFSTMNGRIDLMARIYGQPVLFIISGVIGSVSVLMISSFISIKGYHHYYTGKILEIVGRASIYIFISHIPIFYCLASAAALLWGLWIYYTLNTYWYVFFIFGVFVPSLAYILVGPISKKWGY